MVVCKKHNNITNRLQDLLKISVWNTSLKNFVQKLIHRGLNKGGLENFQKLIRGQQLGT